MIKQQYNHLISWSTAIAAVLIRRCLTFISTKSSQIRPAEVIVVDVPTQPEKIRKTRSKIKSTR